MTKEEMERLSAPPIKASIFDRVLPITDEHKALQMIKDSKTPEEQEHVVLSMSAKLRNDFYVMGQVMQMCPRAYLYAGKELQGEDFLTYAISKNPNVYFVLSEEQRAKDENFNSYRWGCISNSQSPDSSIDKQKFYSVEAYESAFRSIFQDGWRRQVYYMDFEFRDEVKFVWAAEKENPIRAQQYEEARKTVALEDVDRLCKLATKHVDGFHDTWREIISKCGPEIEDTFLKQYREDHWDELVNIPDDYAYGQWIHSELDEHVKKYGHPRSQAAELSNRETSTTDERVLNQQDITKASEKERRCVLEESFGQMVPADLDQDDFRRVFAEETVYSGKHVVVISKMDFGGLTRFDENQQEQPINAADIKAGMECHLPCTAMELYTGQEDSYGHYTDQIVNAVFDGQDLVIETEDMVYTTVDITKEFVEVVQEVADKMGLWPEQLVPAMDKLEAIVAEAERTGPVIGDDD